MSENRMPEGADGVPLARPHRSSAPRLAFRRIPPELRRGAGATPPGYVRWLWDGEFCGTIGLRWQPATEALPPHCLVHIGYAVVPWKQGKRYAKRAL